MKKIILLLSISIILFACRSSSEKAENDKTALQTDTLSYTYDSVKVSSKHVLSGAKNIRDTTTAVITYPVFKNDSLNQYIKRNVFDYIAKEEPATFYQDMANSFINGYDDFVKSNADREQSWFLIIKINVINQKNNYIALKHLHADYTGGAHGINNISYINFNPKTNQPIILDSLIQNNKMTDFVKLAEGIFRKNEKLAPTETLAGKYFFIGDKFALAQNFYISNEGLVFLYNPYEIKPYVEGTTQLIIPFSALKQIAKPNTILTTQN